MFQVERLQKIKQILNSRKSVSVIELSDELLVSEITIRRDFEKLEKDGFLFRTHGGAVLNSRYDNEDFSEVHDQRGGVMLPTLQVSEADAMLGKQCADLVEDYDILFLGQCPSNIAMAGWLHTKQNLVIATNSIQVMLALSANRTNSILLAGGKVNYDRWVLEHTKDHSSYPSVRMNKAFIHVHGIDFEGGVTVNDYEDTLLYQELKNIIAGEIVLVAEGTLFGRVGLYQVETLDKVTTIVTDHKIPDEYKAHLFRQGVRMYQKFNL